jgi:hypothetical protein
VNKVFIQKFPYFILHQLTLPLETGERMHKKRHSMPDCLGQFGGEDNEVGSKGVGLTFTSAI